MKSDKEILEAWKKALHGMKITIGIHGNGREACSVCGFHPDVYDQFLTQALASARADEREKLEAEGTISFADCGSTATSNDSLWDEKNGSLLPGTTAPEAQLNIEFLPPEEILNDAVDHAEYWTVGVFKKVLGTAAVAIPPDVEIYLGEDPSVTRKRLIKNYLKKHL